MVFDKHTRPARRFALALLVGGGLLALNACNAPSDGQSAAPTQLLNVSYDPTRELYAACLGEVLI